MTSKQHSFIESLMNKKDYSSTDTRIAYFNAGMIETSSQASAVIEYLLSCEDKAVDQFASVKAQIRKTLENSKSVKGKANYMAIYRVIGRCPNKLTTYTNEQLAQIATLLK